MYIYIYIYIHIHLSLSLCIYIYIYIYMLVVLGLTPPPSPHPGAPKPRPDRDGDGRRGGEPARRRKEASEGRGLRCGSSGAITCLRILQSSAPRAWEFQNVWRHTATT